MMTLPDVQSTPDLRQMPINQVGIKDLRFPVQVGSADGVQHTLARFAMTVFLPAEQKGTHMSRFVGLLEETAEQVLDAAQLRRLTETMLARLNAHSGRICADFPFFRRKRAPVSGMASFLDYEVQLCAEITRGQYRRRLKVMAPVTSLCPCSKEISQYGAHNQRSHVTVTLEGAEAVSIEEVIDWIENGASSQLYGLLKRPDEKFVTERAYDNPKFVEDMVRDIAVVLRADTRIGRFSVESENFESIHNHSAYARIDSE